MNYESMLLPRKTTRLGDDSRHTLQSFIPEFFDTPALSANQMLVMRRIARSFKAAEPLAKITLHDKPAFNKQIYGSVNSRGSDVTPATTGGLRYLFCRKMAVRFKKHLRYCQSLSSYREVMLPQVSDKPRSYWFA